MSQVKVKKIYQNEQFVGDCNTFGSINCATIVGSVKEGWLIRGKGVIEWEMSFTAPPVDEPFIKGVWVNDKGSYVLVDGTVDDFLSKCNECCGEDTSVTPIYNGTFPNLQLANPLRVVTVLRKDDGTMIDSQDALYKYMKYAYSGFARSSRNAGTGISTYTFNTYHKTVPTFLGKDGSTEDVVSIATTNYDSNVPGALTTGQRYQMTLVVNGNTVGDPTPLVTAVTTGTLADLVAAATANATYSAYGTYSETAGKVRLASSNVISATINIAKVTP